MDNNEVYISTDIEADGPIPGPNSMLSLGAAAYLPDGKLVGTFSVNLETLPGAQGDPDTMNWWAGRPKEWEESRKDQRPPKEAMTAYVDWVNQQPGRPVFVGYPATFDFAFTHWYLIKFIGSSVFSFSALDMKSFAMAVLGTSFRGTTKKSMPREWFVGLPKHTHIAVDDAVEQGALFIRMLRASK
jgi:DNA polymerase III alpha subunit (gram-positive type)